MDGELTMDLRIGLLDLFRLAYREEQTFVEKLSEKERAVIGTYEQWSVKDVIAHVAAWKERTAQELAAVTNSGPRPEGDNLEQINARIFEKHLDCTWNEVLALSKRAYEALCEQVETMPEEDLTNAKAIKWYDGPVWRLSIDDGYSHPLSHFAECYARRGEEEQAIKIRKEAVKSRKQFERSVEGNHGSQ
jgi:Mycothiol maleylpyruvate isomerase N-terminal domain.